MSHRWLLRFAVVCLAIGVWGLAWPTVGGRADGPLEVLQIGWDGVIVPGTWSPVRVRVVGGSTDAQGRLELVRRYRDTSNPSRVNDRLHGTYSLDFALPAGVSKELTLWSPNSAGATAQLIGVLRLVIDGQVVAEKTIDFKTATNGAWPVVGVLAESPAIERLIDQVWIATRGLEAPVHRVHLTPELMPRQPERLRALNAIVIEGATPARLTQEQREAVREWVREGGVLVLAGGLNFGRAAAIFAGGEAPVTQTGADLTTDLSALAQWAAARDRLGAGPAARLRASGGNVLVGSADQPLVWRGSLGQGIITALAVDLTIEPLASWEGGPALARQALAPAFAFVDADAGANGRYPTMARAGSSGSFRVYPINSLPADAFPSWPVVAVVLGLYALAVGPLLHWGLARVDRREWLWVAAPTVAIGCSVALFVVGVGQGGRDILVHTVGHLKLQVDEGMSRHFSTTGFYAPMHNQLAITAPSDYPTVVTGWGAQLLPDEPDPPPPFTVSIGRDTRIDFAGNEWTMRPATTERVFGAEIGQIYAELAVEAGLIHGAVRNDLHFPLEDVAVVVGQSYVRLGDLAPGELAEVTLDPTPATNRPDRFGRSLAYQIVGGSAATSLNANGGVASAVNLGALIAFGRNSVSASQPAAIPGNSTLTASLARFGLAPRPESQESELQRRANLLELAIGRGSGPGAVGSRLPFMVVGFTRAPITDDLPNVGGRVAFQLHVVEQSLRLRQPAGEFTLPAALSRVTVTPRARSFTPTYDNNIAETVWLEDGAVVYDFSPNMPVNARATALVVGVRQAGPVSSQPPSTVRSMNHAAPLGPAQSGLFAIYHWPTRGWDPLPHGDVTARVDAAAGYIDPEGVVRVRVAVGQGQLVRFAPPELVVEGVAN